MKALFNPVRDRARDRGLPSAIVFEYGVPKVPTQVGASRAYMCLDDDTGDTLSTARSQRANPTGRGIRAVGFKFVVFAHDTRAGAGHAEHEDLARQIADLLLAALHHVVRTSKTLHQVGRGRFAPLETTDGWAGRRYEISFSVDTRIEDLTWKGAAAPEYEFAGAATAHTVNGTATTSLPNATTRNE